MAGAQESETDLTLEISGEQVTPVKFLRGVRAFFGILHGVTSDICGERPKVRWLVQVHGGSNLVSVYPSPGYPYPEVPNLIARAVRDGIETLEREAEEPEHFDMATVRHLKDLARLASTDEGDDTRIRVWKQRDPIPVTHSSFSHVATLLRASSEDYGSVEGRLQVASERGRLHVVIYEPLWDKPVRCFIDEDMLAEALSYFRQRVEAYGTIRYRKDGQPISITVQEIIPFPDRHELPRAADVCGILKDFSTL